MNTIGLETYGAPVYEKIKEGTRLDASAPIAGRLGAWFMVVADWVGALQKLPQWGTPELFNTLQVVQGEDKKAPTQSGVHTQALAEQLGYLIQGLPDEQKWQFIQVAGDYAFRKALWSSTEQISQQHQNSSPLELMNWSVHQALNTGSPRPAFALDFKFLLGNAFEKALREIAEPEVVRKAIAHGVSGLYQYNGYPAAQMDMQKLQKSHQSSVHIEVVNALTDVEAAQDKSLDEGTWMRCHDPKSAWSNPLVCYFDQCIEQETGISLWEQVQKKLDQSGQSVSPSAVKVKVK